MEETTLATREIMWNIPFEYKVAMYVMFAISLVVLARGLMGKYRFVAGGKPWAEAKKDLLPKKFNVGAFFRTVLLTGKVPRNLHVGFFHSLIYYGFLILWIATDLVAIHYDTPLKIFKGPLYIVVSFLADIGAVTILVGIALAFHRRYIKKDPRLAATHPQQELFMYSMLVVLVLVGLALEGIRIYGTGMPAGEAAWSPVGWAIAKGVASLNPADDSLAFWFRGLWFFHMANTMAFIGSLAYSKFFHILALPLNALLTPARRGAVLLPMNFENESAETFGLSKLSEMTGKMKMDMLACVECGRCTVVCPANLAGKPLNPKTIITKARDISLQAAQLGQPDADFWGDKPIYSSNELDACTTCGACMEECPANIEHVQIIQEAKRYKALTLGDMPPAAADATNKVKKNGNPWGISQDDRFNWAQGLEVPVIEAGKKVDYLYYVGCAGSYDAANQKVVKDTVAMLKKAGVSFAVMGKTEKCNGDPVRRFGDEYSFYEIAIENIANMRQYTFDKVVTHCPHCLHTIGKEYGKFEDGAFETIHHTELLADLLRAGKLTPMRRLEQKVTFHDPCYLGRHHGEYNAPREMLKAAGVTIDEMEKNKDKALCCGMGGGNMWYELPGDHLVKNRLAHVGETHAPKLATACSYCLINFNSGKAQVKETENLEIEDVASILAKSVL